VRTFSPEKAGLTLDRFVFASRRALPGIECDVWGAAGTACRVQGRADSAREQAGGQSAQEQAGGQGTARTDGLKDTAGQWKAGTDYLGTAGICAEVDQATADSDYLGKADIDAGVDQAKAGSGGQGADVCGLVGIASRLETEGTAACGLKSAGN